MTNKKRERQFERHTDRGERQSERGRGREADRKRNRGATYQKHLRRGADPL